MARKFSSNGLPFGLRSGLLLVGLAALLMTPFVSAQDYRKVAFVDPVVSPELQLLLDNGLNPLGDIVTAGVSISNRKLYRQAFAEFDRERSYYDFQGSGDRGFARSVQGQSPQQVVSKTFHFELIGRGAEFASSLPVDNYELQSYGFQAGGLLKSTRCSSLGVMIGYERGKLRNDYNLNSWQPLLKEQIRSDTEIDAAGRYPADEYEVVFNDFSLPMFRDEHNSTRFDDIYLGLYHSLFLQKDLELRSFIGGGYQRFKTGRSDQRQTYSTTYGGGSFEMNFELGKYYYFNCGGFLLRPYVGMDIEHAVVKATQEGNVGDLFRYYDRTALTQLFVRLGVDLEKRWRRVDIHGGFGYTCLFIGKRNANTVVFYPNVDGGTGELMSGARLGRASWNLKTGVNYHLNAARTKTIYLNYFADLHPDRADDTALHVGSVGYGVRY